MGKYIDADKLAQTFWQILYDYEDETESQFAESEDLDITDWFQHRIFVQAIFGKLLKAVAEAPSIEIPQWIPCSERLPKESGQYFVTAGVEQRQTVIGYYSAEYGRWYAFSDVFAWMPKPAPRASENPLEGIDPKPIPTKKHTFKYRKGVADADK